MKRTILIIGLYFSLISIYSQKNFSNVDKKFDPSKFKQKLIYSDNFDKDISNWVTEFESPKTSNISIVNEKLDVKASIGATVWFKEKLSGNIMITFKAIVIDSGGVTDRVSDLNVFWMASNPKNTNLFTQNGKFSSYDNLNLYYAGIGGNENTTSRFRKYHLSGEKPVLQEYLDKEHLLKGNNEYTIRIIVMNGQTMLYINDVLYFDFIDSTPYKEGNFAFRTTRSHIQYDNFKIFKIK